MREEGIGRRKVLVRKEKGATAQLRNTRSARTLRTLRILRTPRTHHAQYAQYKRNRRRTHTHTHTEHAIGSRTISGAALLIIVFQSMMVPLNFLAILKTRRTRASLMTSCPLIVVDPLTLVMRSCWKRPWCM